MEYGIEYTISEVSELTGYAPHVLRYYEKEFDIEVPRTDSNHRYYTIREVELIQYIKSLQDKGFSNKQIKMIITSPELVTANTNETALDIQHKELDISNIALEISKSLEELFFERLDEVITKNNNNSIEIIEDLKEEIRALRVEMNSKERDVLVCENAKLKMRLKEKTFESIELKEKINKLQDNQIGFFKRLFGMNNIK